MTVFPAGHETTGDGTKWGEGPGMKLSESGAYQPHVSAGITPTLHMPY